MKALVYNGKLAFREDQPIPGRLPGESLIAVSVAGICATDLEITKGYMGFRGIPGHEFVGIVKESDDRKLIGARVVGEINCPCMKCEMCGKGLGKHCYSRSVLGIMGRDGAFAEYLTLPDAHLHLVPENLSDREAVFVEPVAAACQAVDQACLNGGESVFVLGDGKLGLLTAGVFASSGVRLTLVGKSREKLSIAERRGISTEALDRLGDGRIADVVVDATGSRSGLERALTMVRPGGRIVMKTTVAAPYRIDLAPLVVDEITLVGSRCGPFDKALRLLADGSIDPNIMISADYPLERGVEAFERAKERDALKVLLTIGSDRSTGR